MDFYTFCLYYSHKTSHILCSFLCKCTFWYSYTMLGSTTGVMPTSVASYPYWSGSGLVTAGVGACYHIVHCRYARFMCSCIVDEQHTSWLKSSSFLELWYCSHRYSSKVEQSVFFNPDTRIFSACLSSVVTVLLYQTLPVGRDPWMLSGQTPLDPPCWYCRNR